MEFLEKVEQSGKWPEQACTTMFFLIPKNVTSERPIALMPTLIRWWEALRAPQGRHGWPKRRSSTDSRNGGCQQTVWDATLMEMERFKRQSKRGGSRSCGLFSGIWRRHLSGSVFTVVWAWATHLTFPRKILLSALRVYFDHQRRVNSLKGVRQSLRLHDHHGHFARIQVELFAMDELCCRMR